MAMKKLLLAGVTALLTLMFALWLGRPQTGLLQ
jgi:hypothetical protein